MKKLTTLEKQADGVGEDCGGCEARRKKKKEKEERQWRGS